MTEFTFRWQHDSDAYTNGTHPGTGYTSLLECVCLDRHGIPQASRGGLAQPSADIERELVGEALAWIHGAMREAA